MIDYNQLSQEIIQYRRDLHQIPELGFYVYKTSAYVQNILAGLACEVEQIVKTGLIAYFDFGREETVAFRADMDALPIQEETGLPYASTHEGCMHACGHDGHMAGLLGLPGFWTITREITSKCLVTPCCCSSRQKKPSTVRLEYAEHISLTATTSKQFFDCTYGPCCQKGEIASRPGPMMAKSTAVAVEIEGVSAHCGEP